MGSLLAPFAFADCVGQRTLDHATPHPKFSFWNIYWKDLPSPRKHGPKRFPLEHFLFPAESLLCVFRIRFFIWYPEAKPLIPWIVSEGVASAFSPSSCFFLVTIDFGLLQHSPLLPLRIDYPPFLDKLIVDLSLVLLFNSESSLLLFFSSKVVCLRLMKIFFSKSPARKDSLVTQFIHSFRSKGKETFPFLSLCVRPQPQNPKTTNTPMVRWQTSPPKPLFSRGLWLPSHPFSPWHSPIYSFDVPFL